MQHVAMPAAESVTRPFTFWRVTRFGTGYRATKFMLAGEHVWPTGRILAASDLSAIQADLDGHGLLRLDPVPSDGEGVLEVWA